MDYDLISKYFSGKASEEEIALIFQWIDRSPKNKRAFIQFKQSYALDAKSDEDLEKAWLLLEEKLDKGKPSNYFSGFLRYAAIFLLIGSLGYLLTKPNVPSEVLVFDKNAIILKMGDGSIETITELGERTIVEQNGMVVGKQQGSVLNYRGESDKAFHSKPIYNELSVPYGKSFKLVLSDGTRIHLNSGSSIKYPVKFTNSTKRQVFLSGEAFFEVTKDASHPFVVRVNDLNVRVLGTKFNVSSYPEEDDVNTVLVEGSVALHQNMSDFNLEGAVFLEPGNKGVWNPNSKETKIEEVDTNLYTSWMEGRLIFRNTPFKVMRKKLERHYNVSIVNRNKILEEKTYNAVFDVESIEQVFRTLQEIYAIEYVINENNIIIN
ncbi:DUF4974 domain-containing protein [Arenibacter aquaticus]|uniref:DUF4974 domain-containing protein n=1 Tax=Arenibacter aquaticus TaxID=2489054 RepID=A0A3S0AKA0_9FLAO|nr:FecR domain-containing protein [Arenibacter aquaticus]RTE52126.1 DUF4974 domain-containing protein [Arenibacter aquaticus]